MFYGIFQGNGDFLSKVHVFVCSQRGLLVNFNFFARAVLSSPQDMVQEGLFCPADPGSAGSFLGKKLDQPNHPVVFWMNQPAPRVVGCLWRPKSGLLA